VQLNHRHRTIPARLSRWLATALALASLAALTACVESRQARRYNRAKVQASLERLESPGLVIGEFALAGRPVVDGDTIKVEGLDSTLRLLSIDSEETFKSKLNRMEAEGDWKAYLDKRRSRRPGRNDTPMGEEAKEWAVKFFEGVRTVRLERDHPKEIRDRFDRYLAYVFVQRDGAWVNYNVEHVRAGMSPYYTKYSYSRRFHDDFVAAEKEAREAQRGIWRPGARAYDDYDERRLWWDARADFIRAFEQEAQGREDFIVLTHWDSIHALQRNLGREVTVLGSVSEIVRGDRGPSRAMLSRRRFSDLALVFFDKDVFASSGINRYRGEFVRVSGVVNEYKNKYNGRRQLQLIVNVPSQVVGSDVPGLPGDDGEPAQAASNP
jgi:endonuclease YncB( thermonuclease family)